MKNRWSLIGYMWLPLVLFAGRMAGPEGTKTDVLLCRMLGISMTFGCWAVADIIQEIRRGRQ